MVRFKVLQGFYEIEKTIGCGSFAKVKLATHIATGEKVAIKIIEKAAIKDDLHRIDLELNALKTLSNRNICKLFQFIDTETHFFFVIEYCSGGELFDHIVVKKKLTEKESRFFFRQIVSAIAYLHSLGFAHRDVKPENILLDESQNLKLIDFGLCARPKDGMSSPLYTSCGSPTYAAPELVLGKQYYGPDVDVWAMGVLLYALLAGCLPFDDDNIGRLYKKIISGKYIEPSFMSASTRSFIRQMLQVNPEQRIKMKDLLAHPWLSAGALQPVKYRADNFKCHDDDIVDLMAQYHCVRREDLWAALKQWQYDYNSATYMLLTARKNRGLPLKIHTGAAKLPIFTKSTTNIPVKAELGTTLRSRTISRQLDYSNSESAKAPMIRIDNSPSRLLPLSRTSTPVKGPMDENSVSTPRELFTPDNFLQPRRPASIRKRIRSPTLNRDCSPVPAKRTPGKAPRTPEVTVMNDENSTSSRKVLGSIGRSLNKVRDILTPRKTPKKAASEHRVCPAVLANKDLCNVSTTQSTDAEFVTNELSKALALKGIQCERKGYTLRGKMNPRLERFGGCSFELEICYIPDLAGKAGRGNETPSRAGRKVGIRRKRLTGDSWCYKKVCEEVLALTATELRHESDV